jgi:ABC-type phosphate transport system substrate-binding protein
MSRLPITLLLACLTALWLGFGLPSALGAEPTIVVIMAPSPGSHTVLGATDLEQIFKRTRRFWDNGQRIQPANLPANHAVRRAFSQLVFGLSPEDMDGYWREQYFHGELPPYVLGSEEAMIRFVASTPGAIGYVSHCLADHRVIIVARLEGGPACAHPSAQ